MEENTFFRNCMKETNAQQGDALANTTSGSSIKKRSSGDRESEIEDRMDRKSPLLLLLLETGIVTPRLSSKQEELHPDATSERPTDLFPSNKTQHKQDRRSQVPPGIRTTTTDPHPAPIDEEGEEGQQ